MPITDLDRTRLREALELARTSFGLTEPNPRVGCVIGLEEGRVLGQGATQEAGAAHAEIMALRDAQAAGHDVRAATAWVTLEPCAHHGRTPPCCDALADAGLRRCVVAAGDPNPLVAGAGLTRLRAANVLVDLLSDDDEIAQAAREVNVGFYSRFERGRPWVRVKVAASADGRLALSDGRSKWITGDAARADGHAWRRRASAVLTGIGTVLADNPRLDVRAVPTARQPLRVVLDSQLRMPLDAAILNPPGQVLVVSAGGAPETAVRLRAAGVEVWEDAAPKSLDALLKRLADRAINELHVEAGPVLTGALLSAGLVDEWLIYLAPMLLGPGLPMVDSPALPALELARRYRWHSAERVGSDLRLRLVT